MLMKKILAICDQERDYTSRMMEYLSDSRTIPFQIEAFTSEESLEEFAARHPVEILLISERSYSDKVEKLGIGKVIILSEEDEESFMARYGQKIPEGTETVYKYQPSAEVVRETMDCYRVSTQAEADADPLEKVTRIGIFSPCQAPDTTRFSLILGRELAERCRVLYVNLKPYSGISELLDKEGSRTGSRAGNRSGNRAGSRQGNRLVSRSGSRIAWESGPEGAEGQLSLDDLLYCCRQNSSGFSDLLVRMTGNFQGVDYLPEAISPTDLAMVTGDEWERFFLAIEETGRWDILVLELGEGIQDTEEFLASCRRVILPVVKGIFAQARIKEFRRQNICPDGIEVMLPSDSGGIEEDPFEGTAPGPLTACVRSVLAGLRNQG